MLSSAFVSSSLAGGEGAREVAGSSGGIPRSGLTSDGQGGLSGVTTSIGGSARSDQNAVNNVHSYLIDQAQNISQWQTRTELELKRKTAKVEELLNQNDRLEREINEEKQATDALKTHNRYC